MKKMEESSLHIAKWKAPIWKATYYDILWKVKYTDSKKISGCLEKKRGKERWISGPQEIFRAVKLFYMIQVMVDTWHNDLAKPIDMHNTKNEA